VRPVVLLSALVIGLIASSASPQPKAAATPTTASVPTIVRPAVRTDGCPDGFVRVAGEYCSNIKIDCLDWMDPPNAAARRCRSYGTGSCEGKSEWRDFCMERTEHPESNDSDLPMVNITFLQAEAICKSQGHRLCKESEFSTACSGPEFRPYPTGWERRCDLCNCDHTTNLGPVEHRTDYRETPEQIAGCISYYGVVGLVGNVDEFYERDQSSGSYRVAMKGGHWMNIRARCVNASTVAHNEYYQNNSASFRCCHDPAN
jgi:formylglycine-generating enzyme